MATHYYNKQETHNLKAQPDDIYVSVVSGNGQGGSYIVLLDSKFLGANEKIKLGKPDDCKGKELRIIVVIQDKLDETNWTGVIVILSEGSVNTPFAYAEELPQNLDVASYNINIRLK